MQEFKRILGFIWALPVTLLGLAYVGLFTLFGWYRYLGARGNALVWQPNVDKSPAWLVRAWDGWAGHCIGNVIVVKFDPDVAFGITVIRHELAHAEQCMRLGIFQPILYGLSWLGIRFGCPNSHPYHDQFLEVDARRAAGQLIDVVGEAKRIRETVLRSAPPA